MKIIGITGSSGSGKSFITHILKEQLNAQIIDADEIARNMQKNKTPYLEEIIQTFGEEYLCNNKKLNRHKLAETVFKDHKKMEELNKITRKHVLAKIELEIKEAKKEYVIIDAPLLIEAKLNKKCDIVIAVISNKNIQKERICKRDNISEDLALLRLNAQPNNEFYVKNADYVIENNGGNYDGILGGIRRILQKL